MIVGLLIMTPRMDWSNHITKGIVIGVGSGLLFLTRNLMVRRYTRSYSTQTLMFWQLLVTFILLLPFTIAGTRMADFNGFVIGKLIVLGIIFTAFAHTLYAGGLKHLKVKTVSMIGAILPLYAAGLGYLLYDEIITPRIAIGGMIVIFCIVLENVTAKTAPANR